MSKAYLAWRSPSATTWYPIGQIESHDGQFAFGYTGGAQRAAREAGFEPLASFPKLEARYLSEELFPVFANRLLSPSRRDYHSFVEWLAVPQAQPDPIALLARSGGRRTTDTLELFPAPEPDASGVFRLHFFVHGLQHLPDVSLERVGRLAEGEPLLLMHDFQNPHDPNALLLRAAERSPRDILPLGYCPRYLLEDVITLLNADPDSVSVTVLRVNQPPAPIWFRLLCTLVAPWPKDFIPFAGEDYQLVATGSLVYHMTPLHDRPRPHNLSPS